MSKPRLPKLDTAISKMTDAELEKLDIDVLDRAAFGVTVGDTVTLPLSEVVPLAGDLENAKHEVQKDPLRWRKYLDLHVQLRLRGGKFHLEDGHHRLVLRKKLGLPTITGVVVAIDDNPIVAIRARQKTLSAPAGRSGGVGMKSPKLPKPDSKIYGLPTEHKIVPIVFVGLAGRAPHAVEIWQIEHLFLPNKNGRALMLGAYDRKRNIWVGTLDLQVTDAVDPSDGSHLMPASCMKDLEAFAKRQGVRRDAILRVSGAAIIPGYKGVGIGGEMYAAATALAYKMGLALAADACFYSATSEDARRVWSKSTTLRRYAKVGSSKLVAVYAPTS